MDVQIVKKEDGRTVVVINGEEHCGCVAVLEAVNYDVVALFDALIAR